MKQHRLNGLSRACALSVLTACSFLGGCAPFFAPHEKHARVLLAPTMAHATHGRVEFITRPDGVQVTYNLNGLPPDTDHVLQVYERGDCNIGGTMDFGPIFAPGADQLRPGARVAGELGVIHADANGSAAGFIISPDIALDGVRSVISRVVIVHRDVVDLTVAQPEGSPGLACGVVRLY